MYIHTDGRHFGSTHQLYKVFVLWIYSFRSAFKRNIQRSEEKIELSDVVKRLREKVEAISVKIEMVTSVPEAHNHSGTICPYPTNTRETSDLDQDPAACFLTVENQEFDLLRDRLNKVSIPNQLRVHDSAAGIKQECKPALKILSKCARFWETGLKQLSIFKVYDDGTFHGSQSGMRSFTIFAAQNTCLKSEYSSFVV